MKKQIIILALLLNCCASNSQHFIKTTTPVTEEFLQNVPGRWLNFGSGGIATISKQQRQEIFNRLDKIHRFVFDIIPSPVGVDAGQSRHTDDLQFAYRLKRDHLANGNTAESLIGVPVVEYWYTAYFGRYSRGRNNYEMMAGLPREDMEWVFVYANSLALLQGTGPYEMNIDGRPIQKMPVVKGKWKGYTLYIPETGSGKWLILLHRDGMLPYVPVTRKEYLNLSISYFNKMFDAWILDIDTTAKTFIDAGMTDAQTIKEKKENLQKQRRDVVKYYNGELAATTAAGLLDSPAIIPVELCDPDLTRPIFTTEEAGGRLLVTENPEYIRTDLQKYVPQFFVLTFEGQTWSATQKNDPLKAVEENFPIEKLQAMIDK